MLLTLAKELRPHVWLNVHSGMYALFTPYDHKGHVPNTTGEVLSDSVTRCMTAAVPWGASTAAVQELQLLYGFSSAFVSLSQVHSQLQQCAPGTHV